MNIKQSNESDLCYKCSSNDFAGQWLQHPPTTETMRRQREGDIYTHRASCHLHFVCVVRGLLILFGPTEWKANFASAPE